MEQNATIKALQTSFIINVWVERNHIMLCLLTTIITIYARLSLLIFFEGLLGIFLWTGIFMLGFIGIAAHIKYYFHFERNRKVNLYVDRMKISVSAEVQQEILKKDIEKIILCDKLKYKSRSGGYNLWPTFLDPFYYLVVIGKNHDTIILTCLLDIKLKKKIADWYGKDIEHKYQFFPFPPNNEINSLANTN